MFFELMCDTAIKYMFLFFTFCYVAMIVGGRDVQQQCFSDLIAIYVTSSMRGALTLLASIVFLTPEDSFPKTDPCNWAEHFNKTVLLTYEHCRKRMIGGSQTAPLFQSRHLESSGMLQHILPLRHVVKR